MTIHGSSTLSYYEVSQKDLKGVLQGEWLTNNVIDPYLCLVQFHSALVNNSKTVVLGTNVWTNFTGAKSLKISIEKGILEYETVIVPQHHPGHFTIVVLKPKEHKWFLYDSLYDSKRLETIRPRVYRMIRFFEWEEDKAPVKWDGDQIFVPQQGDGSNCGVFSVRFAVFAMFDMWIDFQWSDEDKKCFRYQIVNDLLNQSFSA